MDDVLGCRTGRANLIEYATSMSVTPTSSASREVTTPQPDPRGGEVSPPTRSVLEVAGAVLDVVSVSGSTCFDALGGSSETQSDVSISSFCRDAEVQRRAVRPLARRVGGVLFHQSSDDSSVVRRGGEQRGSDLAGSRGFFSMIGGVIASAATYLFSSRSTENTAAAAKSGSEEDEQREGASHAPYNEPPRNAAAVAGAAVVRGSEGFRAVEEEREATTESDPPYEIDVREPLDEAPLGFLQPREVLVLAGGTSNSARDIAAIWLRGSENREVVFLSREGKPVHTNEKRFKGRVRWVKVSHEQYQSIQAMRAVVKGQLASYRLTEHVAFVSCIGDANPREGSSLEALRRVNVNPLMNTANAVRDVALEQGIRVVSIGNLSSIVPYVVDPKNCLYLQARVESDASLMRFGESTKRMHPGAFHLFTTLSLAPGVILSEPSSLSGANPYGPDQLANLEILGVRFSAIPGSGKQPIPVVGARDLAQAMVNGLTSRKEIQKVVIADNGEKISIEELINFFGLFTTGDTHKVYIPIETLQTVSKHFPYGRLSEYSGLMFEGLDVEGFVPLPNDEFKRLLGKEPDRVGVLYSPAAPFNSSRPPIYQHASEIIRKVLNNPEARKALLEEIGKNGGKLMFSAARAIVGRPVPYSQRKSSPLLREGSVMSRASLD